MPVSYTHLDVYKRQEYDLSGQILTEVVYKEKTYLLDSIKEGSSDISGTVKDNVVITLVYSLDEKDPDDPENPNKPDGVPDKYQLSLIHI